MDKDSPKIFSIGQIDLTAIGPKAAPVLDDLPVIAMRDVVVFPEITFPITLGRESTLKVATEAEERNIVVGIFCQKSPEVERPGVDDLCQYGVLADVHKVLELPDGSHTAILSARHKIRIDGPGPGQQIPGELSVRVTELKDLRPRPTDKEFAVLCSEIRSTTIDILHREDAPTELALNLENVPSPEVLVNLVATNAPFSVQDKLEMLAKRRLKDRATLLLVNLARTEEITEIKAEIQRKTRHNLEQQQRNHFLQQQFDVLREELYGSDEDCDALKKKADELNLPPHVRKAFDKSLDKLRRINPQNPDYSVEHSYLTLLTDLPWTRASEPGTDFTHAEQVLDADHYGLEKVKERILEQLAVMMNTPEGRSPILCLVGAPGVGKTSLGQSIARALGREYQRVSLGGLHDEAEIRGHRRTYIGAMPGRIIDAIKRAGTSNPVLLLDEIDKTGNDYKGDPSSALLEVLDPEQNMRFHDNYVDVDFDLSKVLFIATANTLSTIPRPLLDRMEIIDISGYLMEEKIEIARRHLIPRVAAENGFAPGEVTFTEDAIRAIVEKYTGESGVRQLEKQIAKVIRKIVLRKMRGLDYSLTVTPDVLRDYLGVEQFTPERYEVSDLPGVAVGLAWTAIGGEILFIESAFSPGKDEKLTLTGNLGDVMKESAVLASQIVRARGENRGVPADWFDTHRLHVHVPEGAIPKDGPSAGITLCTSILSAATGRPVKAGLAMTGEITLRGKVLPVGGIKEKILAAKRAGLKEIILCRDNRKDIEDIRPIYLEGLTFHYVNTIDDVFSIAFPS